MKPERYRIAMVDDDTEDVFAIRKGLQKARLEVEFTELSSATALFDYLNATSDALPHLILLDINMPRMNGFDVLQRLKGDAAWRDMPVMVFSTSSQETDRIKSMSLGAAGFVTKFSSMTSLGKWILTLEDFLEDKYG